MPWIVGAPCDGSGRRLAKVSCGWDAHGVLERFTDGARTVVSRRIVSSSKAEPSDAQVGGMDQIGAGTPAIGFERERLGESLPRDLIVGRAWRAATWSADGSSSASASAVAQTRRSSS
jgi:hypothetical protein